MDSGLTARLWLGRLSFGIAASIILFVSLVPLGFTPRFIPQPDLLTCVAFVFILRRPDFVPLWLLVPVLLLGDILMMRPLGLWSALMLVAIEFSRAQEYRFRELVFPFEWGFVAGVVFLAMLANRLILALTMAPIAGFSTVVLHFLVTMLAYPFVAFFCYFVLRVHKVTPDEAIRYGHRL